MLYDAMRIVNGVVPIQPTQRLHPKRIAVIRRKFKGIGITFERIAQDLAAHTRGRTIHAVQPAIAASDNPAPAILDTGEPKPFF